MDLELPSTTVGLDGLCRSAQVNDGVLKSLLVVQPCSAFRVELALKIGIRPRELTQPLLSQTKLLLESLNLGLCDHNKISTWNTQKLRFPNLAFREFCFRRRLVLVVRGAQGCESSFTSLADLLELLYMVACGSQVNLSNLERGTRRELVAIPKRPRQGAYRSSATSASSCCSRDKSWSIWGEMMSAPDALRS